MPSTGRAEEQAKKLGADDASNDASRVATE
jgi:hypothetical protein